MLVTSFVAYYLEIPYILLSKGPNKAGMDFTPYEGEQQTDQIIQYSVTGGYKDQPSPRVTAATYRQGGCASSSGEGTGITAGKGGTGKVDENGRETEFSGLVSLLPIRHCAAARHSPSPWGSAQGAPRMGAPRTEGGQHNQKIVRHE